jgi:tight adherence protein C
MDPVVLLAIMAGGSVLFLIFGIIQLRQPSALQDRINQHLAGDTFEPVSATEIERSRPFSERVLVPMFRAVARVFAWMWPQNRVKAIEHRLMLAGRPGKMRAVEFLGMRLLVGAAVLGLGLFYGFVTNYPVSFFSMVMLATATFCGFYLPDFWLSSRIRQRQLVITNALPDALDMLTIGIEAGLSFESGLQEIIQKWDNELSREFARVLRDIGMGQGRRQALNGLADRTGVVDVMSFVAALNQADELGVSIGRVLKAQAEEMRVRRRQRAHEKANQAPVKIMFPLVFLIFPAIFAVLLGPAVPQLLNLGG